MPEPVPTAPDLKTLIRQTGIAPAAGAGCALTLLAFAVPIAVAVLFLGWSWWLIPAALAGLLLAALVALVAVRRIAHRTLVRLANAGAAPEDGEDSPSTPPDPHALAEAVLGSAWLPGAGPTPAEVFDAIAAEDPALGARTAQLVHDRAVDDLVNGDGPDQARLTRFVGLADVVTEGARRLRGTPAGEPWQALTDELHRELQALEEAMQRDDGEP